MLTFSLNINLLILYAKILKIWAHDARRTTQGEIFGFYRESCVVRRLSIILPLTTISLNLYPGERL